MVQSLNISMQLKMIFKRNKWEKYPEINAYKGSSKVKYSDFVTVASNISITSILGIFFPT